MPSFVNLGAYVDSGTMIDTWATVGSCAQIGKNCHISGGVGIGGVLEPLQAGPVIIEDNCFIGARSEVAEGAIVATAPSSRWAFSSAPPPRFRSRDRRSISGRGTGLFGGGARHPAGQASRRFEPGPGLDCAVIVKRVDENALKTTINELLRD